jgi:hypothetical protein
MPTRWNVGPSPVVLDWNEPAIMPGASYDFTDEQAAAGIAGDWSDKDPRAGRDAEKAFKKRRDAAPATDTPAEPEKE